MMTRFQPRSPSSPDSNPSWTTNSILAPLRVPTPLSYPQSNPLARKSRVKPLEAHGNRNVLRSSTGLTFQHGSRTASHSIRMTNPGEWLVLPRIYSLLQIAVVGMTSGSGPPRRVSASFSRLLLCSASPPCSSHLFSRDEVKAAWMNSKVELTRGWKQRYRDAQKKRRRGGAGVGSGNALY